MSDLKDFMVVTPEPDDTRTLPRIRTLTGLVRSATGESGVIIIKWNPSERTVEVPITGCKPPYHEVADDRWVNYTYPALAHDDNATACAGELLKIVKGHFFQMDDERNYFNFETLLKQVATYVSTNLGRKVDGMTYAPDSPTRDMMAMFFYMCMSSYANHWEKKFSSNDNSHKNRDKFITTVSYFFCSILQTIEEEDVEVSPKDREVHYRWRSTDITAFDSQSGDDQITTRYTLDLLKALIAEAVDDQAKDDTDLPPPDNYLLDQDQDPSSSDSQSKTVLSEVVEHGICDIKCLLEMKCTFDKDEHRVGHIRDKWAAVRNISQAFYYLKISDFVDEHSL